MIDEKRGFVADHHGVTSELVYVASRLRFLAGSFRIVGNDTIADQLIDYATIIDDSRDIIQSIFTGQLQQAGNFAREMTGGILKNLLEGTLHPTK